LNQKLLVATVSKMGQLAPPKFKSRRVFVFTVSPSSLAMRLPLSFLLSLLATAQAAVTVYNQTPLGLATATANAASYTGAAAYNPTVLDPPPVPAPPATTFTVQLQNGGVPGLSIPQHGSFFGFSIEMSVTNQVCECSLSSLFSPCSSLLLAVG
jgi:hypothetical protein